jgi:hypothetical protein
MEDLAIENEKLKNQIDLLLHENKILKSKYANYFNNTNIFVEKIMLENGELLKKLEEKNDKCIKEKQSLKDELKELQKLFLKENYSNKRKRNEIITNC